MPSTLIVKPKPAEAPRRSGAARPKRGPAGGQGPKPRARSSSAAPKPAGAKPRTEPERRRASSSVRQPDPREGAGCPGLREQRGPGPHGRPDGRPAVQSHKAFTVIPPNPKKRREIQKKAEAELAALEELRLSRAMAYVSINPSSVGGCMSLEEVRLKQQQEMMQAKRKQKQVRKQLMEETPVLTR
ncbi:basic salivary proline-rich protein 4 [Poeciliopsis prolifica]|uniref:basic salivary proline-rich protein 4 n=1 Tax=Poeciliopsis prolifica TaxID=188132 RepID=UPI002414111A|nr:basic salivary proline-rich protein 4 [Poeciliopsis prolifica]